jgi:hypothetical protein
VRLLFCGGCNPHIDREGLAAELEADDRLWATDVIVYISGCQRSCRAGQRMLLDTPGAIVVAGEHVDGTAAPVAEIVGRIRQRLGIGTGGATGDGRGHGHGHGDQRRSG